MLMPVRVTAGLAATVRRDGDPRGTARSTRGDPVLVPRLGAHPDDRGTSFARVQPRRRRRAVPARRRRRAARSCGSPSGRTTSGTGTSRASGPASATATGCTARGTRGTGTASTRPSCSSTRTPGRWTASCASTRRCSARDPAGDDSVADARDSAAFVPHSVVVDPAYDWQRRPPARGAVGRHGRLRAAREGLHRGAPRRARGPARHVRRAGAPGCDRAPRRAGRHDGRAAAGAPLRQRADAAPARPGRTTGATTRSASSRRTPATRRPARAGSRSTSSATWCAPCTPPGSRSCSTSSTTTPRKAAPTGPTLSLARAGQRRVLPAADGGRRYVDVTGCGNTLDLRHPRVAGDGHRLAALLGAGDARRRLPVRPRAGAGPRHATRSTRHGTFLSVLAQDPVLSGVKLIAEPWDVGAGGYQLGGFPPPWAEWNDRYRDTVRESWLGGHGAAWSQVGGVRDLAYRLAGSSDLFERAAAAAGVDQLRHRARRLHPARPGVLRPQAQRGQRRGQPRRHGRQPQLELRRRGRDRRPGRARAAPPDDAQPADDAAGLDRRPDADRGRRDRPHPGRQQQRLLPGRRVVLAVVGPRRRGSRTCSSWTRRPARRCAASTRCCATTSSSRAARRTPTASRTSRGSAPTARR